MYKFERLMIGLDLTLMDKTLIEYTAFLNHYFQPKKIYFFNVQASLDVPDEIREKFPDFSEPRDEVIRQEMKEKVATFFPDYQSYDIEFDVVEGSPRKEMLRWLHIKNVDLLVLGRKRELKGSGLLPHQVARKAPCSTLFVPENASMGLKEILVPIDFSKFSRLALEEALEVSKVDSSVKVYVHHAFDVPQFYTKTGKTEQEFAIIMKEHARDRYEEFTTDIDLGGVNLSPVFTYNIERDSPALLICKEAQKRGVDMIMIGARGRDNLSALFLGSVAEKLIGLTGDIPILVVKRKNKVFSFWEMIESI